MAVKVVSSCWMRCGRALCERKFVISKTSNRDAGSEALPFTVQPSGVEEGLRLSRDQPWCSLVQAV